MSTLRRIVVTTVALACLAVPGGASAAEWGAPESVSADIVNPYGFAAPLIAVDGAGTQTALWIAQRAGGSWRIATATKPIAGAWSAPRTLATPKTFASHLSLSVAPNGRGIAGWIERRDDATAAIQVATRAPGGVWSGPRDIQSAESREGWVDTYALGVGSGGEMFGLWHVNTLGSAGIIGGRNEASHRTAAGGWAAEPAIDTGAPQPAGALRDLQVAVDGAGNATAMFASGAGLTVATRDVGGVWSAPTVVAPPGGLHDGDSMTSTFDETIATNDAGTVIAAWYRVINGEKRVQVSRHARGEAWGPIETVTTMPPQTLLRNLAVGVDASDRATIAYSTYSESISEVLSTTATAAGPWSQLTPLTEPIIPRTDGEWFPAREFQNLRIDVAGNSQAVAAWERESLFDLKLNTIEAAVRVAGGTWEPSTPLVELRSGWGGPVGMSGSALAVGVDAAGNASVLWNEGSSVIGRSLTRAIPNPTVHARVAAIISPFGAARCPAKADVWTGAKWVALPTVRVGSGALRCSVTGDLPVAPTTKVGSTFPVLVSAWGFWPTVTMAKVVAG